ncbi:Uncharacterised protein [Shigella sonnei]|nr:Uncharacterised protein [Shigella sonnei]
MSVCNKRDTVAAKQVIQRNHNHPEQLRKPGFSVQSGAVDICACQRLIVFVALHQCCHQNRTFIRFQPAARILPPDNTKHFLVAIGSPGKRGIAFMGHIACSRFTKDHCAALHQGGVGRKNLLQPA